MFNRKDKEALDQARTRVAQLEAKERTALTEVVETLRRVPGLSDGTWQVHTLVAHADAIRDALEPFDSGVRCAADPVRCAADPVRDPDYVSPAAPTGWKPGMPLGTIPAPSYGEGMKP